MIIHAPTAKIAGQYRAVLRDELGRAVYDSGWFDNLITDRGLLRFCGDTTYTNQGWTTYGFVGSGTTAPTYSDTALDTKLGHAVYESAISEPKEYYEPDGSGDYGMSKTRKYRFEKGVGTGTIREVGVGYGTGNPPDLLFSRSILPSPITKASDNILDLSYKLYGYADLSDKTGQITLDSVLYNYLVRPLYYGASQNYGDPFAGAGRASPTSGATQGYLSSDDYVMGADFLTGSNWGTLSTVSTPYIFSPDYVAPNLYRDAQINFYVDTTFLNDRIGAWQQYMWPGNVLIRVAFDSTVDGLGVFKDNERDGYFRLRQSVSRGTGS